MYKKYATPCLIYGMWGSRKMFWNGLTYPNLNIVPPPRVINCQTHQDGAEVELPQVRFERGLDEAEGDGRAEDAVGAQRDWRHSEHRQQALVLQGLNVFFKNGPFSASFTFILVFSNKHYALYNK